MKLPQLLTGFVAAACILITLDSCERVHGCTDPAATNYNADAQVDNGTCTYAATFYFDQNGPNATVSVNNLTGMVTANYQTGAPSCGIGATGCANFSLLPGTYPYTASSTLTTWSGTVQVSNGCALVDLQQTTGAVTFWTAGTSYGTVTVFINGTQSIFSSYITGGTPLCGASGCATFNLPPGNYTYTASSSNGITTLGPVQVTVTADGCQPVQLL